MSQQKKQSLWRWICMRILALAMGSVVLIALCMWLRFVIQKYWVLHHMPASQRAELAVLFQHPERDIARFHQLVDAGWGISYSMPDIGSSDWLMLAALIVIALPIIMIFGLRVARPLSEQFSRLAAAARSVARGEFGTRAGTVENAPAELAQFTHDFNLMSQQLERYDRELRTSHVAMAHELRSPLTAAIGRLQGMIDGVFEPDPTQLNMVMKQLQHLNRLTDELHLLSLADAGQLSFSLSTFDLTELLRERVIWMKPQAEGTGMSMSVTAGAPAPFRGDPFRLGQVFTILMENALRYAGEGKVLDIDVQRQLTGYLITFRDRGPGVEAEFLPLMFERFARADSSRARHSGGSGLGLSIARAICEACGGQLVASLPAEGGLMISLHLPFATPEVGIKIA
ncbi:sensor histidine kinase [Erwinia rhapontici]|uniref:histidine kinase n=1 Tax=Erwinia rhapontici TaxID=55212 RepID=A0ABM7N3M9_ERWRD|nr:ATP-binding protein [Erwinia rhapontici]MCS3608909.1 signal transduction histidine kinase [Erwinia rhapontici]BCQ36043.1 two-component sensor histidine kinase [Erwinia rhapontici]BCQ41021.1 two-component sensor histidine kinase [Erwinia rhapontici]